MSHYSLLQKRVRRQRRIRYKLQQHNGRNLCRLSVFKSNSHLYTQIINDQQHQTLVCVSTLNKELQKIYQKTSKSNKSKMRSFNNQSCATKLGEMLAVQAKKAGITEVIFDRGRYLYHGVIKALGDTARMNGLKF